MERKSPKEWHQYIGRFDIMNDILVRNGHQPLDISKLKSYKYALRTVATTDADALGHLITQYAEIYRTSSPRYVQDAIKPDSEDLKKIIEEIKIESSTVREISESMQKWKKEMENRPKQLKLFSTYL